MKHKRYLVTGKRKYRWHQPGTVFEARLEPDAERRAIERGSIQVLEEIEVGVGSYVLPDGWPCDNTADARQTDTSAPVGVSRVI